MAAWLVLLVSLCSVNFQVVGLKLLFFFNIEAKKYIACVSSLKSAIQARLRSL